MSSASLHAVCRHSPLSLDAVRAIVEAFDMPAARVELVNAKDKKGTTPLMLVGQSGSRGAADVAAAEATARYLLEQGAYRSVHAHNRSRRTAADCTRVPATRASLRLRCGDLFACAPTLFASHT